jgi:hypothetical protein
MKNQLLALSVSFLLATNSLLADASYTKTRTIKSAINTSSPMMAMMGKMGGGDMLKALEPTTDTVMVRGNKMATVTKTGSTILDLDKQAMIQTDSAKHEYSVITFQQLSDMMERMEKMANSPMPTARNPAANTPQVETETTVDIKEEHPGTTKIVDGLTATEHIFKATITTHMKDTSGQATAGQNAPASMSTSVLYTEEIWVLDGVPPAYQAVLDFYKLAGEKMASAMSPAARETMPQGIPNTPGAMNGMVELQHRVAALKGLHVIEVTRVNMAIAVDGQPGSQPTTATNSDQSSTSQQPAAQATTQPAAQPASQPAPSKLGGLGGALARGALGGFGSKKSTTPAPSPTPTPAPAAQTQPAPASSGNPFLSETTVELSNFSTQSVPASEFEIPSGYKQVPSPIEKLLQSGK